ncbi:MAG: cytochrome B6 [Candidatus Accumulibacter sp.]|uniref:cytochrome-c peroxidase n=1 Tax=Accumulibacter sp. TaxID=2053492 RepID=UPI00258AFF04|nr:cytochrome c peroxidase [Accumulibacter sp.]MBK8115810.1 cytochrome B6 [Accumulibacter sp.]
MRRFHLSLYLVLGVLLGGVIWLSFPAGKSVQPSPEVQTTSGNSQEGLSPILLLTPLAGLPPERVMLGEQIFRDTRLSADLSLACVSCHDLRLGGADGRQFSLGIGGAIGGINAPSVFNSGFSFAQFWDGRAASLEEQAAGPIHNPLEMGSNWAQVLQRLGADAPLLERFANAYPDGLTADNIANAIATFERSLVTVNSRFDRYLRGERQVLTVLEIDGYRRFREFGCISCHQGVLVGGNMYQKFGVLGDYFADRTTTREDLGRYNVTKRDEDRHVFKVPSLRNVALTAPYFHDGAALTLEQAVTVMARYQLGRELSGEDIESIVAFLETLTGSLPEAAPR